MVSPFILTEPVRYMGCNENGPSVTVSQVLIKHSNHCTKLTVYTDILMEVSQTVIGLWDLLLQSVVIITTLVIFKWRSDIFREDRFIVAMTE